MLTKNEDLELSGQSMKPSRSTWVQLKEQTSLAACTSDKEVETVSPILVFERAGSRGSAYIIQGFSLTETGAVQAF